MKSATEINEEIYKLHDKILSDKGVDYKGVMEEIRAKQVELQQANKLALLNGVNSTQARLREKAKLAFEAEQPMEDITTNDGSFHKVKIKKYPKLGAIEFCTGVFNDGLLTVLRINGEKFKMYHEKYNHKEPTIYTSPATFEEFLNLNDIMVNDLTLEEYNSVCEKLDAANKALDNAYKAYEQTRKELKISQFDYYGLIRRENTHTYKSTCK